MKNTITTKRLICFKYGWFYSQLHVDKWQLAIFGVPLFIPLGISLEGIAPKWFEEYIIKPDMKYKCTYRKWYRSAIFLTMRNSIAKTHMSDKLCSNTSSLNSGSEAEMICIYKLPWMRDVSVVINIGNWVTVCWHVGQVDGTMSHMCTSVCNWKARLTRRSREVSKPGYWVLKWSYCSVIWQERQQ